VYERVDQGLPLNAHILNDYKRSVLEEFWGMWLVKVLTSNLIEIVAGLTFMLSIFNNSISRSE
ncbi:hypothetical protein ACFVR1_18775, partial [Psychrobacillus sp. NPDC058041]|uniref:hypothetical protein n=1 Tax=Psychrobacillus sp. NPDC058041 TaxID=3346310 RepID=UPI0036DD770D